MRGAATGNTTTTVCLIGALISAPGSVPSLARVRGTPSAACAAGTTRILMLHRAMATTASVLSRLRWLPPPGRTCASRRNRYVSRWREGYRYVKELEDLRNSPLQAYGRVFVSYHPDPLLVSVHPFRHEHQRLTEWALARSDDHRSIDEQHRDMLC